MQKVETPASAASEKAKTIAGSKKTLVYKDFRKSY